MKLSEEEVEESEQEIAEESQQEEEESEEVLGVTPEDMKLMTEIIEKLEEAYEGKIPPEELQSLYKKSRKKEKKAEAKETKKKTAKKKSK